MMMGNKVLMTHVMLTAINKLDMCWYKPSVHPYNC